MNKLNKTILVTGLALTSAFSVVGCSKTEEVKQEVEEKKEEVKEEVLKTIGTKTDSSTQIKLANRTGSDITSLVVEKTDGTLSENLLADGYANDEVRNFFYEKEDGQTYDLRVLVGDTEYTLHGFPMDAKDVSIHLADGVAYIEYTDANGEKQSTKDNELALVQEVQAAQQQVVEPVPVQQQTTVQQAPAVSQQTPVESTPAPAVESTPAPTQQQTTPEEGCVPGVFD